VIEELEQSPVGSPTTTYLCAAITVNCKIRLFLAVDKADNVLHSPRAWIS